VPLMDISIWHSATIYVLLLYINLFIVFVVNKISDLMSTKTKRQQQIWLATVKCCQFNVSTDKVRESTDDVTITLATYDMIHLV